jgi:hypothetical protein
LPQFSHWIRSKRFVFVISVLEGRPEQDRAIRRRSMRATSLLPACWRSSVWQTPTLLTRSGRRVDAA